MPFRPVRHDDEPINAAPRTTMRYDRARNNLDRHPHYILAAYMAPEPEPRVAGGIALVCR